jgi:allantoate deiminase
VASPDKLVHVAEQVIARCQKLARISEDAQCTTRTFLSPAMRVCYTEVTSWLVSAGAEVRVDAAGNLHGFCAPEQSPAPRLLIGSHLDTVPNAGAYDGVLGVVLAVALLEKLEGRKLPFGIEVIGFSEEEGVRFGVPFVGSRALVGQVGEKLLNQRDAQGISVKRAIEDFGLDPDAIREAMLHQDTIAYLEFHIEQGPMLEALRQPLGVVEAIAGQTRMHFIFSGRANHVGTTPMNLRRDAIAGAAEWIGVVEQTGQSIPELVATCGSIDVKPGAVNVIASEARVSLDVRHKRDGIRENAVATLVMHAEQIAGRRGLSVQHSVLLNQKAVPMDSFLVNQIEAAVRKTGCEPHRMTSGAGHDAMILAEKVPAAMIFLRTPGGISHDPAESVEIEDVAKALECGLHLLEQLAASSEFLQRTCRA